MQAVAGWPRRAGFLLSTAGANKDSEEGTPVYGWAYFAHPARLTAV